MAAESCSIVTDYVHIVEQLPLYGLKHQYVALLQLRLVLGLCSLVLCQLLQILLRRRNELASIDSQASTLTVDEDVHAFAALAAHSCIVCKDGVSDADLAIAVIGAVVVAVVVS